MNSFLSANRDLALQLPALVEVLAEAALPSAAPAASASKPAPAPAAVLPAVLVITGANPTETVCRLLWEVVDEAAALGQLTSPLDFIKRVAAVPVLISRASILASDIVDKLLMPVNTPTSPSSAQAAAAALVRAPLKGAAMVTSLLQVLVALDMQGCCEAVVGALSDSVMYQVLLAPSSPSAAELAHQIASRFGLLNGLGLRLFSTAQRVIASGPAALGIQPTATFYLADLVELYTRVSRHFGYDVAATAGVDYVTSTVLAARNQLTDALVSVVLRPHPKQALGCITSSATLGSVITVIAPLLAAADAMEAWASYAFSSLGRMHFCSSVSLKELTEGCLLNTGPWPAFKAANHSKPVRAALYALARRWVASETARVQALGPAPAAPSWSIPNADSMCNCNQGCAQVRQFLADPGASSRVFHFSSMDKAKHVHRAMLQVSGGYGSYRYSSRVEDTLGVSVRVPSPPLGAKSSNAYASKQLAVQKLEAKRNQRFAVAVTTRQREAAALERLKAGLRAMSA